MVTGLGFGDMNLAICEGVPRCLMTMATTQPIHTHTHTMKQVGHKGHCSLLRGSSYNHLDLHHDTLIPLPPYPLPFPFAMLRSLASLVRSPSVLLPVPSPCPAFPIFWPWHHMHNGGGKDDDLCRYVVLLCVWVCACVLACVCSCAHAHVRKCRWFVRSWFLSFSVFVCLLVCVGGGGGGLLGSMHG